MATKIAVIDDSEIFCRWLTAGLSSTEFEVLTLTDPSGAEDFIRKVQPDILLLDVLMPELGGDDICKRLKTNPYTKDITIVFLSNVPEAHLKDLVKQCSADGYIVKTDDPAATIRKIRTFLERKAPAK